MNPGISALVDGALTFLAYVDVRLSVPVGVSPKPRRTRMSRGHWENPVVLRLLAWGTVRPLAGRGRPIRLRSGFGRTRAQRPSYEERQAAVAVFFGFFS